MDLNFYLRERAGWLEAALTRSIQDESIPETLRRAMRYSLEAGGKRIRPILCFAGAEAAGGSADRVMPAAVALEMIHTFSLIHDDLPAMDDDSMRRGKPTSHKVFGEAVAILAGDGLIAEAFSVLSELKGGVDPRVLVEAIHDIASATGGRGMTGGQAIDIESTGAALCEADLARLHRYKTGALIRVSAVTGARLSGGTREQLDALGRYGECVGLAFQIADDILDVEGDQSEIGKDVGSDQAKGKSTYPAAIGIEAARGQARALVDQAVSAVAIFGEAAEPLRQIARYIVERKR
ncbi:MAG: polyprenyl synthetase family protein [Proteobacteria bacterium]|nr:polyprenyl synthetase family protein [Pseudomonadota bacterium]